MSENRVFSLIWWNTSLFSAGKRILEEEARDVVFETINFFIECETDFIALTEISEKDVREIREKCNLVNYRIQTCFESAGRGSFDFCIIYRAKIIIITGESALTAAKLGRTYRLGYKLKLSVSGSSQSFHVIVSHWPSRISSDSEENRNYIASRLRAHIDEKIIGPYRDEVLEPNIILMGDYNDEPFDKSLAENIMATRDKRLAKTKKDLFYNPFWGEMHSKANQVHIGSYYYKNGEMSKWRTLDQIIYSHSLVHGHEWEVIDDIGRVVALPGLLELVTSNKSKLDHLPIIGILKKAD